MKRFFMLLTAALLLGATGCTSDNDVDNNTEPQPSTITLDSSAADFTANGGAEEITFIASGAWSAEVINSRADGWCSVEPMRGEAGSGKITITTLANDTPDDRTASVIIKTGTASETVKVSQKQKNALTLTASRFEVSAEGGEVTIEIKANVDYEYVIDKSAEEWISYAGTRALKTSNLCFKVAQNEEVEKREGGITIQSGSLSEQVTIYQEGEKLSIVLSKNEYIVSSAGETITVEVKSNVDVEVEIPADADWISENTTRALSTNTFRFDIAENPTYDQRTAEILFTNKANNLTESVTVIQSQKDAIVLTKSEYEFEFDGGRLDFEIQANVEVWATISDNAKEWILPMETRALDPQKLSFDVLPNNSEESREGAITLTGGNAKQTITIKQSGIESINPEDVPDNEIWYRTTDSKMVDIYSCTNAYGHEPFNTTISSHFYEKGLGVIRCNDPITKINDFAFGNFVGTNIIELYLPDCIEHLGTGAISDTGLTTLRIPKNLKQVDSYGLKNLNLGSFTGEHVSGDGRCVIIDGVLCGFAPKGIKEYSIPEGVRIIGSYAFSWSEIEKVIFPEGLEYIDGDVFLECENLKTITLPKSLEGLHPYAFRGCSSIEGFYGNEKFTTSDNKCLLSYFNCSHPGPWLACFAGVGITSYTIPDRIKAIENYAFNNLHDLKTVTIPASVEEIGSVAFYNCPNLETVYGPNTSDDHRAYVRNGEFVILIARKNLPVAYHIPDNVTKIGYASFQECSEIERITMNDQITHIDGYAFSDMTNLKSITLSAGLSQIGYPTENGFNSNSVNIFIGSSSLETIFFRSLTPPSFFYKSDIESLYQDSYPNLTVYVPRGRLEAYKNSDWHPFAKYMKEYEYTDLPFDYISSDYSQDGKVTALQTATVGEGIDVVLMGDGYSDRQIADGTYRSVMERAYNNLFTEEPYRSHKEYFNVYYVNAVSATEGYDYGNTAFAGYFGDGTLVGGDDNAVFTYAQKAISAERMDEALLVVMMNSENYAGTCYMYYPTSSAGYGTGVSVSYFPVGADEATFAELLHHEANGHGFSKLADEYAYDYMGEMPSDQVATYREQQSGWGWWQNVDFTSDADAVLWAKFLDDSRYANEGLGLFEGGLTYWSGVWRPTENSIMRYNTGGFNAPSREAIYKRIHHLAYGDSWEYDYEEFVAWDAINRTEAAAAARRAAAAHAQKGRYVRQMPAPPVVVGRSWREAK